MEHCSAYVTCPDLDTARRIARSLLERRLVACANILPVTSLYRWEGAIQEEPEVAMLMKTRRALMPEIERVVREEHPYELPCIVALAVPAGDAAYLAWVDGETRPAPAR